MKIGVIGYGGTIGSSTVNKLLNLSCDVIGGQRHKSEKFSDKVEFIYADINDPDSIENFVMQCDAVVNCSSPSYIYGNTVVSICERYEKIYFESTDYLLDGQQQYDIPCFSGCGFSPGITEYLPLVLSKKYFDKVERVNVFFDANIICSSSAFVDMILCDTGLGDNIYVDGQLRPFYTNLRNKHKLNFLDKEVFIKSVLTKHGLEVSQKIDAGIYCNVNTYENFNIMRLFFDCLKVTDKRDLKGSSEKIIQLADDYKRINDTDQTYNNIFVEISGKKKGRVKALRCSLKLLDAGDICGNVLAEIVDNVLHNNNITNGTYNGYDFIPDDYLNRIENEIGSEEIFKIEEIGENEIFKYEDVMGK